VTIENILSASAFEWGRERTAYTNFFKFGNID